MACQRNLDDDIETCCLGGICQCKVMFLAGNNQVESKARFRSVITKDQKHEKRQGYWASGIRQCSTQKLLPLLVY